jgi:fluoride exporter
MRSFLVVAIGGAIGAVLRWSVGELIDRPVDGFPWATFVVNVTGCLLIGLAAGRLPRHSDAWLGAVVGVLGGLTTFSTFAVETRSLVDHGRSGLAFIYVAATLVAGLAATELAFGADEDPT